MTGEQVLERVSRVLRETVTGSTFLDNRLTYTFAWEAASDLADRSRCLIKDATLTTVAEQSEYTLPGDFIQLGMTTVQGKEFIKYSDGTSTYFLYPSDRDDVYYGDRTTSQSVPDSFTIYMATSAPTQQSGTVSAAGAATNGLCTLSKTGASFSSTISPGDLVYNTTDGSEGVVVSVTSNTALVTALFNGTGNDWSEADNYLLVPRQRTVLALDPPPSTASHTITVPYVSRPTPVFSPYGSYMLPGNTEWALSALTYYTAAMYKELDQEPALHQKYMQLYEMYAKRVAGSYVRDVGKLTMRVNWKKTATRGAWR